MADAKGTVVALIVLLTIAGGMAGLGFATPWMITTSYDSSNFGVSAYDYDYDSDVGTYEGFYQICARALGITTCRNSLIVEKGAEIPGWVRAIQACGIIGMIATFIAWCLTIGWVCSINKKSTIGLKIAVITLLVVGVAVYIGAMSKYTYEHEKRVEDQVDDFGLGLDVDVHFGWSFYAAWIGSSLLVACIILALFVHVPTTGSETNVVHTQVFHNPQVQTVIVAPNPHAQIQQVPHNTLYPPIDTGNSYPSSPPAYSKERI